MDRAAFISAMLPHAVEAIGRQHGFLVRWAIAKAGRECAWNPRNILILGANNCLGIKAVAGVEYYTHQDSTADGRDDGKVAWRKFATLTDCFREFVRMLNDREPYHPWRDKALAEFEMIYAARTPGHALGTLEDLHDVTELMEINGLCDQKGRIKK